MRNKILQGNAEDVLKTLPDESINMCMTSPPYWSLRDYGTAQWEGGNEDCDHIKSYNLKRDNSGGLSNSKDKGRGTQPHTNASAIQYSDICGKCGAKRIDNQLGLESTIDEYINKLCNVFDEVKRVLRDDGTCWVVIGDTYSTHQSGGKNSSHNFRKPDDSIVVGHSIKKPKTGLPEKCLCQIPARFSLGMINRGWILRNVIIWHKPSCMPSSASDRFTVDFENVFFFSKKKKYYFEQQFEELKESSIKRNQYKWNSKQRTHSPNEKRGKDNRTPGNLFNENTGRNKRTTWSICPKPYKEAHFATYPEELIITCIKAGCPKEVCTKCRKPKEKVYSTSKIKRNRLNPETKPCNERGRSPNDYAGIKQKFKGYKTCECKAGFKPGIVLDPFFGSGTTGLVALKNAKDFIGIELNPEYIKISKKRLDTYLNNERLDKYYR